MATELAVVHGNSAVAPLQKFDQPRLDYVRRRVIAPKDADRIDQEEFELIILEMRHRRMDPLLNHTYVAFRNGVPKVEAKIDHYRVIGMMSGLVRQLDGPYWCGPDERFRKIWYPEDDDRPFPAAAVFFIRREGLIEPVPGLVLMASFAKFTEPDKNGKIAWPENEVAAKLGVCAERQAWRRAFPEYFGGLYGGEEMPEPDETDERPARRGRGGRSSPAPRQDPPRQEGAKPKAPPINDSDAFRELRDITKDWTKDQKRVFNDHIKRELGIENVATAPEGDQRRAAGLAKTFLQTAAAAPTPGVTPAETAAALGEPQDQAGEPSSTATSSPTTAGEDPY